jgi:hypothetical protein
MLLACAWVDEVAAQTAALKACVSSGSRLGFQVWKGLRIVPLGEECARHELPLLWDSARRVPDQVTDSTAAAEILSRVAPTAGDFTVRVFSGPSKDPLPKVPRGARVAVCRGTDYTPARFLAQRKREDELSVAMEWMISVGVAAVSDPSFETTLLRGVEAAGYVPVPDGADFTIVYDELETYHHWQTALFSRTYRPEYPMNEQVHRPSWSGSGDPYKKLIILSLMSGNVKSADLPIPEGVDDTDYPGGLWKGYLRGDLSSFRANPSLFLQPILSRLGKKIKGQEVRVKQPKK